MCKEIGSEFHHMPIEHGKGIEFPKEGTLVFSGRTAIEAVLKKLPFARSATLPSYCCDSMIEPFRRAGIEICYFDVNYKNGLDIHIDKKTDILLFSNYFGCKTKLPDFDGIIIEDITHSLLSDYQYHPQSNYLVASLRKWEPIYCGGYCSIQMDGLLPPKEFIQGKKNPMNLKTQYLKKPDKKTKITFLKEFNESNAWLEKNYSGLLIDPYSKEYVSLADIKTQKSIRRRNAHILYNGLKDNYQFLFPEEDMDCPLFVPIIVKDKKRDKVRQRLIDHRIYCPVHWPHPKAECQSNLYDIELSLICDQRYTVEDMERIISVLCD